VAGGETSQEIWEACVEYGDLVFDVHDQEVAHQLLRLEAYAARMHVGLGDRLSRVLLALSLYAASRAAVVTTGRPLGRAELAEVSLDGVMAGPRWHYELFAGLDAVTLEPSQAYAVNVLKLCSYEVPGSELALARLDGGVRNVIGRLARRLRVVDLTLRDVMSA
jgi:hypothetical protein